MATRGRKPGSPKVPGSGRVKGKSLDRSERQLVTSQMAGDIMAVYEAMGGVDWLLAFAQANPKEFIQQGLSRLFPAAQKEGDDTGGGNHNTQNNYYNMTPLEAAQRVAFALSVGARELDKQQLPPIEAVRVTASRAPDPEPEIMSPQEACRWVAPDQPNPSPHQDDLELDPARQRWIDELPLTDEQRADNALCRETVEGSIETYRGGSSAEQFDAPRRPSASQPSAGERRRAVMSRRNQLL